MKGKYRPRRIVLHDGRTLTLRAPIAPGMLRDIGIAHWQPMPANRGFDVPLGAGVIALDGEAVEAAVALLQRGMRLTAMIQDGELQLMSDSANVSLRPVWHKKAG